MSGDGEEGEEGGESRVLNSPKAFGELIIVTFLSSTTSAVFLTIWENLDQSRTSASCVLRSVSKFHNLTFHVKISLTDPPKSSLWNLSNGMRVFIISCVTIGGGVFFEMFKSKPLGNDIRKQKK